MSEEPSAQPAVSVPVTAPRHGDAAPAAIDGPEPQRTAPISVLLGVLNSAQNAIIPFVLIAFGNRGEGWALAVAFVVLAVILGFGTLFSYIRWRRLTYTIGAQDIRVESGVISRAARSVPFERIQDVSLEQKLLPRLFGLVQVKFETGAGGGEDLSLAYLTEDEGERLRQVVRERRAGVSQSTSVAADSTAEPVVVDEEAETLFAMDATRIFIFGLFSFSLAIFAVLIGVTQQFEFLLPFDLWDFEAWEERLAGPGAQLAGMGQSAQIIGGVFALFSLILVGIATGLIRTTLREWGFLLERTARGFRRRRGLLTKTDVVMPIHRVQGIKIGTRFIRYRFGWHGLKFVSLAQDMGAANHDVAPFAKMSEIEPIVEEAGFHLPGEDADWHRASEKYRTDSIVIDSVFFFLGSIAVYIGHTINGAPWLIWIAAGLVAAGFLSAGAALYSWQFKRHALDATQIMARSGVFSPSSQIATRLKLHSVEISQGPIAQRRGYGDLHFGLAGGTFSIPGVPIERAREVRRKVLETISATDFSEMEKA